MIPKMANNSKRYKEFTSNTRATSYAISAVIITATTIVLVLVASSYAYQILDQQRGASEFDIAQKSMLSFDDALRDIAWSIKGSRSARFTVDYGQLMLFPNDEANGLSLNVTVMEYPAINYSTHTGFVKYAIPTRYVTYGDDNYSSYILGDSRTIVSEGTETQGCLLIKQDSDYVTQTLSYRVKAMETSSITVDDQKVSYVDVWIIILKMDKQTFVTGDLDLIARASTLTTEPEIWNTPGSTCNIRVQLGDNISYQKINLNNNPDSVVFNFIISEVQVS
jgi:hypothetical protein